jgi:methylmalonyl-CoA/ethylmalonyl-CoA epimerase
MPSGPFAHVCLLVKDLDQSVSDWTKILSVLDPEQLTDPIVKYDDFAGGADRGMRWATFVAHHGCEIQLIQPAPDTPLGERLEKLGEHVHHLCFTTPDVLGAMQKLAAQGIQLASGGQMFQDPTMPWQRWGWVSHKSAHGVLLEIASPYESHQDAQWHPAGGAGRENGPVGPVDVPK